MKPERIELSQRERDRLRVLQQVEEGKMKQVEAARRLGLTDRHVRRLLGRMRAEGDRAIVHGLRGRPSNRRASATHQQRILARVKKRYADFGPTLASEHLATEGLPVSRETLRKWMSAAGLWRPRRRRVEHVHVWRERRAAFGELVMWDSSPYPWLEDRGPRCHLIAMIDDASSRIGGRFTEHDTTEENLRVLQGWLERHGRPLAFYTDKAGLFRVNRAPQLDEQLNGREPETQIRRALRELNIDWIPAHSPQAKGRIENLFGTLQDRLVKEMRLAGVNTLEEANHFFEVSFIPFWEQRFAVPPRSPLDAHRRLDRSHRLEHILSVRIERTVAQDATVVWQGQRWGVPRNQVCAGLRGARAEIERRLDGSHWLRFRGRYLSLRPCPEATRSSVSSVNLRLTGRSNPTPKPKRKYTPPPDHPWRRPWKRTFLSGREPDISTLR